MRSVANRAPEENKEKTGRSERKCYIIIFKIGNERNAAGGKGRNNVMKDFGGK